MCYLEGTGIERDEKKALELFLKIAPCDAGANFFLGKCYEEGRGVEKDEAKAKMWRDTAKKNEVQFY